LAATSQRVFQPARPRSERAVMAALGRYLVSPSPGCRRQLRTRARTAKSVARRRSCSRCLCGHRLHPHLRADHRRRRRMVLVPCSQRQHDRRRGHRDGGSSQAVHDEGGGRRGLARRVVRRGHQDRRGRIVETGSRPRRPALISLDKVAADLHKIAAVTTKGG
jgi:hypothetical protein